jgi:hypothetical protein
MSVQKADEVPLYYPLNFNIMTNEGTWQYFADSTQLSADKNQLPGATIAVYGFSPKGHGILDLDEITLTVKKVVFY